MHHRRQCGFGGKVNRQSARILECIPFTELNVKNSPLDLVELLLCQWALQQQCVSWQHLTYVSEAVVMHGHVADARILKHLSVS